MLRPRRVLPTLALLALLALPAGARAGAPPRLAGLPDRALVAGEVVELGWSAGAGEVEELEVLLSVDGGRHYPIRVTPSLDAGMRTWRWRVPDLPTEHARLCVRFERAGMERAGEPTPEFRITTTAAASGPGPRPAARVAGVHEAGWWDVAELERAGARRAGLAAGPRAVLSAPEGAASALAPRGAIAPRAPGTPALTPALVRVAAASLHRTAGATARTLPKRE